MQAFDDSISAMLHILKGYFVSRNDNSYIKLEIENYNQECWNVIFHNDPNFHEQLLPLVIQPRYVCMK